VTTNPRLNMALRRNRARSLAPLARQRLSHLLGRPSASIEFAELEETDEGWRQFEVGYRAARQLDPATEGLVILTTSEERVVDDALRSVLGSVAHEHSDLLLFYADSETTGAARVGAAELTASGRAVVVSEGDLKFSDGSATRGLLLDLNVDDPGSLVPRWDLTAWGWFESA